MASDDRVVELAQVFPQAALDAIPQPMWIYGRDGVAAGCNRVAETFWKLPREHIVGKYDAFAHAETPDGAGLRPLVRAVRAALAHGTVEICEPVLIDLAAVEVTAGYSKQQAYIENTIFPLRDAAGEVRFAAVLQRAVALLGAHGIVSGVSPAVAQTLASPAADMAKFETCRNLSDALLRTMRGRERAASGIGG